MTEYERLMTHAPAPAAKRELYERLAARAAFLLAQIGKMETEMTDKPALQEYDNGGGQTGVRVNPLARVHLASVKEYRSVVRDLAALAADDADDEMDEFDSF